MANGILNNQLGGKVLSIEIGNFVTRVCQMDYKKKNPRIYRHITIPTPDGAVDDGYISNEEMLAESIKEALSNSKMKGTKKVIFSIDSSKILTREIMVPAVRASMVSTMIQTNLSDYFPIDLSNHQVAHLILEQYKEGENAGKFRVLIIAAEKSLIKAYTTLAASCGLELLQLDYVGNSIFQTFKNEKTESYTMALKIEEKQTSVTILQGKNLILQRGIGYGIEEIIQEVASRAVFGVPEYKDAWSLIKRKSCLRNAYTGMQDSRNMNDSEERSDSEEMFAAKQAVTQATMPLINAISRVIDYYGSRTGEHAIEKIIICGMGGDFSGLSKLMSNELGIKTTVLRRLEQFEWLITSSEEDSGLYNYVSCIGATLAPVDLMAHEAAAKESRKVNYKVLSALLVVFTTAVCATLGITSYSNYKEKKDENGRLRETERKYEASEEVYEEYLAVTNLYTKISTGNLMRQNPNDNLLLFFEELEKKLPQTVVVTGISSTEEGAVLTMHVLDEKTAAGVIEQLREFDSVFDVAVSGLERVEVEVNPEDQEALARELAILRGEYSVLDGPFEGEVTETFSFIEFTVSCLYYPSEYTIITTMEEQKKQAAAAASSSDSDDVE